MNQAFIVSYPRSGNTWMRRLLALVQHPEIDSGYKEIDYLIPDIHQERKWDKEKINEHLTDLFIRKSHYQELKSCLEAKNVYIYRDPRDVALSCYYYEKRSGNYGGSFEAFLLKRFLKHHVKEEIGFRSYGWWGTHVEAWMFKKLYNRFPVKYEDLKVNTLTVLSQVVSYLGITTTQGALENAVEKTQWKNNIKRAATDGQHPSLRGLTGTFGGWKTSLTEKQNDMVWEVFGDPMEKLGYRKNGEFL